MLHGHTVPRGSVCTRRCSQSAPWSATSSAGSHRERLRQPKIHAEVFNSRERASAHRTASRGRGGEVNLAAAVVLFVRPRNFVKLPLKVTFVKVGGQLPTRAHSSGCARTEAQNEDCFGAHLGLPFALQQSQYELFSCLLECEKIATLALVSILVVAVVPSRTFIVNIFPPRSTARPWLLT